MFDLPLADWGSALISVKDALPSAPAGCFKNQPDQTTNRAMWHLTRNGARVTTFMPNEGD
jgi:hypothetical protein